ncbi:MAG TPA: EmrB/QacA family drug resistance transporter, partial [Verrucomicrobiae bacterium]|nr:EmrB/QacA family drug resistance transporter [Verrucomicrobiae bacterium]
TNRAILGVWMAILGIGIGMVMPVLTLAVQNAVERKDLGTATSTVTFFRSIGSSLGAAIFGAILINRLTTNLQSSLPGASGAHLAKSLQSSSAQLKSAPPAIVHTVLTAFASAFSDVFLIAIPFAIVAFLVSLFLKESPLRESSRAFAEGEGFEPARSLE